MGLPVGDVSSIYTDSHFARMMDLFRGGKLKTDTVLFKYSEDIKQ
jgi:hypothetical protein